DLMAVLSSLGFFEDPQALLVIFACSFEVAGSFEFVRQVAQALRGGRMGFSVPATPNSEGPLKEPACFVVTVQQLVQETEIVEKVGDHRSIRRRLLQDL